MSSVSRSRSRSNHSHRSDYALQMDLDKSSHHSHISRSLSPGEEKEKKSSKSNNKRPARPRWQLEMARGKQSKTKTGKPKGFGSFYQRKPFHYSHAEKMATQGHEDRVRTVDLTLEDCAERELADDNSCKPSDWKDRTSIDPAQYSARKDTEREMEQRREQNKKLKRSS